MKTILAATAFLLLSTIAVRGDDRAAPAKPVNALLKDLQDSDWEVRVKAADALADLGRTARDETNEAKRTARLDKLKQVAGASLTAALQDKNEYVREAAAGALGWIGVDTKAAVNGLVKLLAEDSNEIREAAAIALGQIGRMEWENRPGIPALLPLLQDESQEVREAVAEALNELSPLPANATLPLVAALGRRNESMAVRLNVVDALGDIGTEGKQAIPALLATFQARAKRAQDTVKDHRHLRCLAAEALGFIAGKKDEEVVKAFAGVLNDESEPGMVRQSAAEALGTLSTLPAISVPALIKALKGKGFPGVRYAAAQAIGDYFSDQTRRGPQMKAAREALTEVSKGDNERLAAAVREALAKFTK